MNATAWAEQPAVIDESAPDVSASAAAPVRVLHVINGEDYSGAERVQDLLAQRLPSHGFEVGFACVLPDRFPAACQAKDAPIYRLPMRSRVDLRPARELARLIKREGYQLLHAHSFRAALIARPAALLAGVPMIHHMHLQTVTDGSQAWRRWLYAAAERLTLIGVRSVIVVSETMQGYVRKIGIGDHRIRKVINGVPGPKRLPPRVFPSASQTWTIGCVAMYRPRKGLEVLLEAIALLRRQGLDARLRAVGRFQFPDHEAEVHRLVARLGLKSAVDWTGFTTDVNAELDQMDIFVLPSLLAEGLPMSVIEAMAVGVPVAGSDVDGIADTIRNGVDGLLAPPGDAAALARVLAQMIRGEVDVEALRTSAHARQVREFSDDSMAAGIAQVYREVLALPQPEAA